MALAEVLKHLGFAEQNGSRYSAKGTISFTDKPYQHNGVFTLKFPLGFLLLAMLSNASISIADEGMWLFNQLPEQFLSDKHSFQLTPHWAEHVMLSSVRFNSGGSASFVSDNGLVLTNHHVAADTLYKLSTAENNYHDAGFLAKSHAEELKAPDLELNQLVSIEDVTDQVNSVIDSAMSASEASKARQAKMSEIEQQSLNATSLRSDVVTLFGGGKYHLYRYKKYTDVRLVWAPEAGAAFFGGDADNFEYPRYCLDVTLFRVYENDQPAKITHYLRTEPKGATDGDLIFVSGNPGRTRRIFTADALCYQRDTAMPRMLNLLRRKEILLQQYAVASAESARRSRDDLFGIQNSRKAYIGMLQGLQNPIFIADKRDKEKKLLAELIASPDTKQLADAWNVVTKTQEERKSHVGQSASLKSHIYAIAETINLMVTEDTKPSGDRLREFRDSNRESLEQELFSPAPMYRDLERILLADELARMMEDRGGDDAIVIKLLNGKTPRELAIEAIDKTTLFDVESRRKLVSTGLQGVQRSVDPLIVMARVLESEYRRLDNIFDEIEERERQAYAKINQAQFATAGDSNYPDATFTLRLAFGTVVGYTLGDTTIPSMTTMGGAFEHQKNHGKIDPWVLPKSWNDSESKINGNIPYNFVCTADIIGGNSGSPVVNRSGNLVGIIFDGNIDSLTADFYYSDKTARAVAVHISGILEALTTIYHADGIVKELTTTHAAE